MTTLDSYSREEFIELPPDEVNKTLPVILGLGAASRGWSISNQRGFPPGARLATTLISAAGGAGVGYLFEKNYHNRPRRFVRVTGESDMMKSSSVRRAVIEKVAARVYARDARPEEFADVSRGGSGGLSENIYRYGSGAGALIGGVLSGGAARLQGGSIGSTIGHSLAGAALGGLGGLGLTELFGGPQLRQQRRALRAEQEAYDMAQHYLKATKKDSIDLPDRPDNRWGGRATTSTIGGPLAPVTHSIGATIDRGNQRRDLSRYLQDVERATRV